MKSILIKSGILLGLLSMLLISACIFSKTFVIDRRIDNTDITEDSEFLFFSVDLREDEDWEEHQDEIASITSVGFELWADNLGSSDVSGEFFVDEVYNPSITTAADVRDNTTQVLSSMTLVPGDNYIDWPTSLSYIMNRGTLADHVLDGEFVVYILTETLPFELHVDSATVIVTFTYSK
jgi:hypothetical protein